MSGNDKQGRHAERRHLTALFSDLSDSTALAASVDPEEYAGLLDQLNQTFEQIIQRHGGTISQVRGDGVFAVFGMKAREDEGRCATEAALELHQAVKNLTFSSPLSGFTQLTMHSGIHSGRVLAIEGDQLLGRFVLVGDAANLASRLSDSAERDEILVSEASLGAHRGFFDTGEGRSLRLKGSDESLVVYPILGHSQINTRFEARGLGTQTPMMGRERELNILRVSYEQCAQGTAQTVSIVASPGLGKTRLAEEFFRELETQDCLVLRGYCESYLNAEPLQPVLQMLRQLLALPQPVQIGADDLQITLANRLGTLAPELATYAATFEAILVPTTSIPRPPEEAIVKAVSTLVQQLATVRPLVIFVDDWQWADDPTRAALRTTPELAHVKLMLVRCSREVIPGGRQSEDIRLQPLDQSHSTSMIEALIPNSDRAAVNQVRQASGGNPLFIEELCHAVIRGLPTPVLHERWHASQIPNYLNMLIVSRVAQLSPAQLELLRTIAVMGNVVPRWLLESMVDVSKSAGAIRQLTQLDLVFPGEAEGSLRFKHGITRDVILDSLNPNKRRALHLQVARVIESRYGENEREAILETLAYHYGETSEHDQAANYAEAAADKALSASAMDRARLQFHATLRALDKLDEDEVYERWMAVAKRLAVVCLFDAEREQCAVYQRAVELSRARNDTANQTEAEYWLAYINYALGEAAEAMIHIDRALELVREFGNEPLRAQILAIWGQIRANACDYEAALPVVDEALALQGPFKRKPRIAFAYGYSLAAKGMLLGDQGRFDEAAECLDESMELTRGPIHPTHGSIMSMRAAVHLWQGRWDEALDCAAKNVEIGDRIGSRYISAMGTALAGYAKWHLEKEPGVDAMSRALSWVETNNQAIWTSMHFSWLCELLVELGRYQEARRCAVWVLKRARKLERLGESVAYCALAEIPSSAQAVASAERCFSRARKSADRRNSPRELALIDLKEATWLEKRGLPIEATEAISGCREQFSTMSMYWYASEAQRLEAKLTL